MPWPTTIAEDAASSDRTSSAPAEGDETSTTGTSCNMLLKVRIERFHRITGV